MLSGRSYAETAFVMQLLTYHPAQPDRDLIAAVHKRS